jgi:aconitate hydratase
VRRADGNPNTHSFVASPELVTALALSGRLDFNPAVDTLEDAEGRPWTLQPPSGDALPTHGFDAGSNTYEAPPEDGSSVEVLIDPSSERIQLLPSFEPWDGKDIERAAILIKVQGKCTTDHISAAGPWLKLRGHLDNISNNFLIGGINAENGKANCIKNVLTGEYEGVPQVARQYKAQGLPWIVIGDENYGEGSAREQAAIEARYLGGVAVIARSFARIHETNLKKQGVLPLTFAVPSDYDRLLPSDTVSLRGLAHLSPAEPHLTLTVHREGAEEVQIPLAHTLSSDQIEWFQAGSALNMLQRKNRK